MSEHLRLSSPPASSSPGRPPSISRPDWPWAARSYSQRSQQSSPHPSNSTVQGSNLHSGWDPRTSFSSNSGINQSGFSGNHQARHTITPKPLTTSTMGFLPGETTRQWSFTVCLQHFLHVGGSYNLFHSFQGFEWAIREVSKLRDFVEGVEPAVHEDGRKALVSEAGEFEILKQSPILGDHKFKLEIGM